MNDGCIPGSLMSVARSVIRWWASPSIFLAGAGRSTILNMRKHWLSWVILSSAMQVHCDASPQIDSFLTLSPPSLVSNQVEFTLTGEADVPYVIETSSDTTHWLAVVTNTSPEITRSIVLAAPTNDATLYRAWREPLPMFFGALVVRSNIALNGNSILIDSYDSGDTNFSTANGNYDPTKRKAGGDLFCAVGLVDVGNATIKGKLVTGPLGNYVIGTNGSVGDFSWVGPGLKPGWNGTNFHWALPDVMPPYQTGLPPAGQGTNFWHLVGGYDYIFNGDFTNKVSTNSIYVAGNANLFVTGNFYFTGKIIIASGASLKLYVGGLLTRLNEVNTAGGPTSFQYVGLPTNELLSWYGNDEYAATIYAPQAEIRFGGGGSDTYYFGGACVAESVTFNGHFNVHYDENLKRIGPSR
jgi:hypothetical protein